MNSNDFSERLYSFTSTGLQNNCLITENHSSIKWHTTRKHAPLMTMVHKGTMLHIKEATITIFIFTVRHMTTCMWNGAAYSSTELYSVFQVTVLVFPACNFTILVHSQHFISLFFLRQQADDFSNKAQINPLYATWPASNYKQTELVTSCWI